MKIERVLFWVFTLTAVVLLLWLILGDSPTNLFVSSVVGGIIVTKMWSMRERQIKLEMGARNGFDNMKRDIGLIKEDLGSMKQDLDFIKEGLVK
ncbi:hypothetical protein KAS08_05530 [Candidatus Pacearchaeota archaeon]|nr:hypothetical protein [Candidatus Pacearchaeota archaeon]